MADDKRRMILHSGGGYHFRGYSGFLMDEWIIAHIGKERPRVCLLTTPQGDADREFTAAVKHLGVRVDLVWAPMFNPLPEGQDAVQNILTSDVVMIPGGYAQGAVGSLKAAGWDQVLREAWENGVLIAAMCAGAMSLSADYVNRWMDKPGFGKGMAFINRSFTAHAQHKLYQPLGGLFRHGVRDGIIAPGYQLQDGFAMRFEGTELVECVTTEPAHARGWYIDSTVDDEGLPSIIEQELQAESLEERLRLDLPTDHEDFAAMAREMDRDKRHKRLLRPLHKGQDPQDGDERITRSLVTPDVDDVVEELADEPSLSVPDPGAGSMG